MDWRNIAPIHRSRLAPWERVRVSRALRFRGAKSDSESSCHLEQLPGRLHHRKSNKMLGPCHVLIPLSFGMSLVNLSQDVRGLAPSRFPNFHLDIWLSSSAGSIPDSYDIHRYLNLVRYSIFDTPYFRRKCNFVYIFRGYLKRLRHKKSIKKIQFKKKNYETLRGKRNPEFFSRKCDFFRWPDFFLENPIFFIENPIFFYQKSDFFSRKSDFFPKTYEIRGVVLCHILLFENIRNPAFGHFPSFPASSFMPPYLQYLTQCGVKPGLYSVRRSTQTELRKRIYADMRIMAFILLRRSRRVCTRIVGVFTLGICAIPTA